MRGHEAGHAPVAARRRPSRPGRDRPAASRAPAAVRAPDPELRAGSVDFAVSIPQIFAGGTFDPAPFRAYVQRAEALGFHSAWAQEQILGTTPLLGPARGEQ
jgi:hypothetical protein